MILWLAEVSAPHHASGRAPRKRPPASRNRRAELTGKPNVGRLSLGSRASGPLRGRCLGSRPTIAGSRCQVVVGDEILSHGGTLVPIQSAAWKPVGKRSRSQLSSPTANRRSTLLPSCADEGG